MMDLKSINALSQNEAFELFRKCCGSERWVRSMVAARPFTDRDQLLDKSRSAFDMMERNDWLEAFAAHPKIGDINSLKAKYGNTKNWATNEQAGAQGISDAVAADLAASNDEYLKKFGFIFIVCATGKTADEMLSLLKARLDNDEKMELPIAALEQQKITHLRLEKL